MKSFFLLLALAASNQWTLAQDSNVVHAPFADDLTMELYNATVIENECTSSLGVSMAMSLIYPSATADSELEMRTVLGYPNDSQSILLWEDITDRLVDRYQGRCYNEWQGECGGTEPTLEIANRVYVDEAITLDEAYEQVVGELVQQLDFGLEDAGSQVNEWVNETTNGLIDSIVDDGPLDPWVLVAINSIYLKASWTQQFSEDRTSLDSFYLGGNMDTPSDAHFMHQVEFFQYSHDALPGFQVLQLPFAGSMNSSGLSMIFVLPVQPDPAARASSVEVLAAIPNLQRTQMALAIPKFRFESEYKDDLKAALQFVGLEAPFDPNNLENLCVAANRCDGFIDAIIQKTYIDVNEKGVEAAAVTAIGVSLTSMPPPEATLFLADGPFQFFIYEENEDLVLFEGEVGEPGIVQDSKAPMTGKHTDEDFWTSNFGISATMPDVEILPTPTINPDTTPPTTINSDTTPPTTTTEPTPLETTAAPNSNLVSSNTEAVPSSSMRLTTNVLASLGAFSILILSYM